jgi:hypothetical protein
VEQSRHPPGQQMGFQFFLPKPERPFAPAANWSEAAEKVRYLLKLFAATPAGQDPRRQTLIAHVLDDFARLSAQAAEETSPS